MNVSQFNKIIVVSLCDRFSVEIGKQLSQSLDMIFCDTKDLMEYELCDIKKLGDLTSVEYLLQSERKVIKHISSFENVVVAISYDHLIHNLETIKQNALLVFVKLPKEYVEKNANPIELISYSNHSKDLSDVADVTLFVKNTQAKHVCEKILEKLGGIL